jgi:hypothetical protein
VESLFHRSIGVSPLCLADNEQDQVHGMRWKQARMPEVPHHGMN